MPHPTRLLLSSAAAFAALAISALQPAAAAYPERAITVVCASGAGGAVDVTTRIIVDHMSRTLGQNIVVQNEPGAGGTISIGTVKKADPDGYTLLTIGPSVSSIKELFPNATVDAQRDLEPVSEIGLTPLVLMMHESVPAKDYPTLVAYMKANPGKLTFASNGRGSAGHLAGSLFKREAGVDLRYIPYRSTPQATADLMAGRVSMIWLASLGNVGKNSSVRPIGVSLVGERWKLFPDVPTFDELGLKGYEASTWVSMYAPKGAPADVVEKLASAVKAAMADPAVQKRLDNAGVVRPKETGPAHLKTYLDDEIKKWGEILRTTKDTD